MIRAVITGSTGLIGGALVCELLGQGDFSVVALARNELSVAKLEYVLRDAGYSMEQVEVKYVDMMDIEELSRAIEGSDVVFHLAGRVDLSGIDVVSENVKLTEMVVEACLSRKKRPLLIHASSIAALPETIDSLPIASPYARSKFLSENQIWRARMQGLEVGVLAPAVVLGVGAPGSGGLQPMVKKLSAGSAVYASGSSGFVDVKDVARAMVRVVRNPALQNKRLVLCGANLGYKDLVTMVTKANGKRAPFLRIGVRTFKVIALIMKLFYKFPIITVEMGSFMFSRNSYDGSLIESLDKEFRYTPIEKTIKEIVAKVNAIN